MNLKATRKPSSSKRWAEGAIVYQIYPRSFYDASGDGIGDIPGIIAKLGYLKELGVNAIWLSPFYPSPMADFGYDVADYCDVDSIFGQLKDMDRLIKKAHAKSIKVMCDLVPNHTSDEHEWFRQSRQSREDKYSDWYVWRNPKGHDKSGNPIPPNNWLSIFSGETAWEWEPARQQFYLHSFDVKQVDLNWANPEVREAFKDVMRFWLDRGVDGFRVDAARWIGKDPMFKDNPNNPHYRPGQDSKYNAIHHKNSQGWPELFAHLNEMADVLKEEKYRKSPRFMVTESYPDTHEPIEEYLEYYRGVDPQVSAPFNFEGIGSWWDAAHWNEFLKKFHGALEGIGHHAIASYAFGNHDQNRLATRLGDPVARSAAVMLLTLPGMVYIYNGEEIGMTDGHVPKEYIQDPSAQGDFGGRDPERTPLHWSDDKNAGFSDADHTWLPIAANYRERNIKTERKDPASYFSLYKKLCSLRNKSSAIHSGKFTVVDTGNDGVLGYIRSNARESYLVLVNFTDQPAEAKVPGNPKKVSLVISSLPESNPQKAADGLVHLQPHEAAVFAIK